MRNFLNRLHGLRRNVILELRVISEWEQCDVCDATGAINALISEVSVLCDNVDYCVANKLGVGDKFACDFNQKITEFVNRKHSGNVCDRLLNLKLMLNYVTLHYEVFISMMEGAGDNLGKLLDRLNGDIERCSSALEYLVVEYN